MCRLIIVLLFVPVVCVAQHIDHKVVVYPNPFVDQVSIDLGINYGEPVEFRLYNLFGETIYKYEKDIADYRKRNDKLIDLFALEFL